MAEQPDGIVVVLSFETMEDMAGRGFARPPDRFVQTLAREPAGMPFLVAAPFRSRWRLMAKRALGRTAAPVPDEFEGRYTQPLRLRRRDATRPEALRREYRRYDELLRAAAGAAGMRRPAVISFHPLYAGFAEADWAHAVTYYARDDWATHPSYRRWWPAYEAAYSGIRTTGRRVAAVSRVLLDRLDPTGPGLVLPNGVDEAEWRTPDRPPRWFSELPAPRMLYLGTLDERLDLEQVGRIADATPGGSVVLAGPLPEDSPIRGWSRPNVHVVGSLSRAEVVAATCASDVCLLTHRRTPLTEAMSPLKLYEYLAGGSPVVATDLAPVRGISDRVMLVEPGRDVLDGLEQALAVGRASSEERLQFVHDNSWSARHRQLVDLASA